MHDVRFVEADYVLEVYRNLAAHAKTLGFMEWFLLTVGSTWLCYFVYWLFGSTHTKVTVTHRNDDTAGSVKVLAEALRATNSDALLTITEVVKSFNNDPEDE